MQRIWIHINNDRYWENPGIVINLPALPRIGETVYLSELTMQLLIDKNLLQMQTSFDKGIEYRDNFYVEDICYIEDDPHPHILLSFNQ